MMILLDSGFKSLPQDRVDGDDDARDQKYIQIPEEILKDQTSGIIVILNF